MNTNWTRLAIVVSLASALLVAAGGAMMAVGVHIGFSQSGGNSLTTREIESIASQAATRTTQTHRVLKPRAEPRQADYFGRAPKLSAASRYCEANVVVNWSMDQDASTALQSPDPTVRTDRTDWSDYGGSRVITGYVNLHYYMQVDTLGSQLIWWDGSDPTLQHITVAAVNYAGDIVWVHYAQAGEHQVTLPQTLTHHGDWTLTLTGFNDLEDANPEPGYVPGCAPHWAELQRQLAHLS